MIVIASTPVHASRLQHDRGTPSFRDYPVHEFYTGENAPLEGKYSSASAKTGIKEASLKKATFSGHYVVALGSCGTSCRSIAIVDVTTGKVYHFDKPLVVYPASKYLDGPAVDYRKNSQLIILRGSRGESRKDAGAHYYIFRGNRLIHLLSKFVKPG
jgi:hypothetical protein